MPPRFLQSVLEDITTLPPLWISLTTIIYGQSGSVQIKHIHLLSSLPLPCRDYGTVKQRVFFNSQVGETCICGSSVLGYHTFPEHTCRPVSLHTLSLSYALSALVDCFISSLIIKMFSLLSSQHWKILLHIMHKLLKSAFLNNWVGADITRTKVKEGGGRDYRHEQESEDTPLPLLLTTGTQVPFLLYYTHGGPVIGMVIRVEGQFILPDRLCL